MELIGLYLVAAALLVGAGSAKVLRPDDTARAFASTVPLSFARMRRVVRLVAAAELVLGAVALVRPEAVPAALVALSYLGFAAFLVVVRARGGALASCGCFGRPDTPVTGAHVAADAVLGLSAAAVAAAGLHGTAAGVLAGQPWHGAPLVAASLVVAVLTVLVMDQLARVSAVRRTVGIVHARRASGRGAGT